MKKLILVLSLCIGNFTFACEPCPAPTYSEAFTLADLVVVAELVGKSPAYDQPPEKNFTKIKISKVLKGDEKLKELKVKAYYAMCSYGLFLSDDKPHLIFLRKTSQGYETLTCRPQELPVVAGKVTIKDEKVEINKLKEYLSAKRAVGP